MLLVIDVGNTNTLFAVWDGQGFPAQWRIKTDGGRTPDEYFVWLSQLMTHAGIERRRVKAAIVSQVVPDTLFNIRGLCRRYFGCEPMVVGAPGVKLGVEVRVDRPSEVGADRLVNTVAGFRRYGPNLIVIDFGTATTFDVVDEDGAYAGGIIAPGVNLSMAALHQAAAKLPRVAVEPPARVIGKSTVECMQSGIFWGYVSMVEGICHRIKAEKGCEMTIIGTGGLSRMFDRAGKLFDHIDPDLTVSGLVDIYRLNEVKQSD